MMGCKDATVGADLTGAITGTVLNVDTNEPIANASVSTSPPTSVPVTGENGQFQFEDVSTGTYTLTATRAGYGSNSITVAVSENETAQATIFLDQQTEPLDSTGTILGTVLDADTNEPIANASVTAEPGLSAPVTGEDGQFQFEDVPVGSYTLTAARAGYDSSSVSVGVSVGRTVQATIFLDQEEAAATGTISGTVFNASTDEPLARASVTTDPPLSAPVTGEDGQFQFEDVPVGSYTLTATRAGYDSSSVSVGVSESETVEASIFLEPDTSRANVTASVTNWSTSTEGDDFVVDVEYRVRNTSNVDVAVYEVDFRINTANETFLVQETGQDLLAGQTDVGEFQKNTRDEEVQEVFVDRITFEEEVDGDDGNTGFTLLRDPNGHL